MLQSPTIDVTVTEEKLDEMLKELEDINKSIASPSSSDDENDATDDQRKLVTLITCRIVQNFNGYRILKYLTDKL